MKEYIAETGGRYTYADDVLNLQELSLSMTSVFADCSNFIISGCAIEKGNITPGYVWINQKVRHFGGASGVKFPYYIFEKNSTDSVTYANDVNKRGRCNYLCSGASVLPDKADVITGKLPGFIEMTESYSPRLLDKFFGKYSLLSDSPFSRQILKKDLLMAGKLTVQKEIESDTSVAVANPDNGYSLKSLVMPDGDASIGTYLNGLLISEIAYSTDGSFRFLRKGKVVATVDENGLVVEKLSSTSSQIASIHIHGSYLDNTASGSDEGAININYNSFKGGAGKFRNLNIYNGKQSAVPIFQVCGKDDKVSINGSLVIKQQEAGITLINPLYKKDNKRLTATIVWLDSAGESMAHIGYDSASAFTYNIKNGLGDICLTPAGFVDIRGDLRIDGVSIGIMYVTQKVFGSALAGKVDVVKGKQLTTIDFTEEYEKKLRSINKGTLSNPGDGYVTTKEVSEALSGKVMLKENLGDLPDKGTARNHLQVYSKGESDGRYLRISQNLTELVAMSADEVNGMSAEQIAELKTKKQATVRDTIDAEKKGTGNLKLAKSSNLSDLPDKATARKNISVYSVSEIDELLKGKLSTNGAYTGEVFTADHKKKLEGIKTGNFAGTNASGVSVSQVEGYVLTSGVIKELAKKANLLLDGYNASQKTTIAGNIGVYSISAADAKFAALGSSFQDYITHLVKQGKSTGEAQKILRDKLNTPSKEDVTSTYVRKDKQLADLSLPNADAKKAVCARIGAAYASEYQKKLIDTGWVQMANSGSQTNTSGLFVRQIGNIVSIQGTINTGRRNGSHWGGIVAVIPNNIAPPKYSVRTTLCDWNNDHKYNRGSSFVIRGGSRNMLLYESGWNNVTTEINLTYMI